MDEAIRAYYQGGIELGRLERGYWRLEFARTKELLLRYLPPAPARVLDVGGALAHTPHGSPTPGMP